MCRHGCKIRNIALQSAGTPRPLNLTKYLIEIACKVGLGLTALTEFWYLKGNMEWYHTTCCKRRSSKWFEITRTHWRKVATQWQKPRQGPNIPCSDSWCRRTLTCPVRQLLQFHGPWQSTGRNLTAWQTELGPDRGRRSNPEPDRREFRRDQP